MLLFIISHPIQYFAPLYRYLTEMGIDLEVWFCSDESVRGGVDREFGQTVAWDIPLLEGYRHRFFPNKGRRGRDGRRGFAAYHNPGLVKALKEHSRAVVVVPGWSYSTYVGVLKVAPRYGHRLVFRGETHLGMEMALPAWKRWARKIMLRWLLGGVDHFLCIGQRSREFYQYLGVPDDRISLAPYAVDNARFRNAAAQLDRAVVRQTLHLPADALVVLFSGKYIAKKRPGDLLEAFAAWNHPQAVLVLMGEGELRPALEARVARLGLGSQVVLTGFVNQSSVAAYYKAADVLVMCSGHGETWGLSVNEAMNFALPVVVSEACGCAPDLVEPGANGWTFPTGDVAALTQCLQSFGALSPAQRDAMGRRSLEIVDRYSFGEIGKAIEDLAGRM